MNFFKKHLNIFANDAFYGMKEGGLVEFFPEVRSFTHALTGRVREIFEPHNKVETGYMTVEVRRWNPTTRMLGPPQIIVKDKKNLLTTAGRDFFHYQNYTATTTGASSSSTTATRAGGVIALSADTGAPAVGDTAVAGEITSGGLARTDASTKTHTVGTNTTSLQTVFTATALQTAVQKSGLFNVTTAPVSGVLTHENTFTAVTLQINDTLTITWTTTLG